MVITGRGAFGSGARYADWTAIAFLVEGADSTPHESLDLRFTVVRLDDPSVSIDPSWDGMSLRASATDSVHYNGVRVPIDRCRPWYGANRAGRLRDPDQPVINHRYREDWVGLTDIWLAAMAGAVIGAALDEAVEELTTRRALMGASMAEMATVQRNLGEAFALLAAADEAVVGACGRIDRRFEQGLQPSESDELRTQSVAISALDQVDRAARLLLRTLGGNGLREGGTFERRWRDLQAMLVHINAHPDRVHLAQGRHLLGAAPGKF
jgi:alkylation response protein AidB-like acyl-CoA dehydrogenase